MDEHGAGLLADEPAVRGAARKERRHRRAESLRDLSERRHRGRGQIAFNLGQEALGEAGRLRQLLERLPALVTHRADPLAERAVHAALRSAADRAAARSKPDSPPPRPCRRTMRDAVKMHVSVTTSMTVATALTTGEMPNRSIEKILSGSVVEFAPDTKKVSTKSSNENVNASRPPARMAGYRSGIVMRRSASSGV